MTKRKPSSINSGGTVTPEEKNLEFIKSMSYQICDHRNCQHQLFDHRIQDTLTTAVPSFKARNINVIYLK